jgi:single-strand DNA-binding protein
MQKINVSGEFTVGTEPTLRFTPAGKAVCSMRVVNTPRVKEGEEWVDGKASWYNLTAFSPLAENVAEEDLKGKRITVSGTLTNEEWTDKEGNTRVSATIIANSIGRAMTFPADGQKRSGGGQSRPAASKSEPDPFNSGSTDEPPF